MLWGLHAKTWNPYELRMMPLMGSRFLVNIPSFLSYFGWAINSAISFYITDISFFNSSFIFPMKNKCFMFFYLSRLPDTYTGFRKEVEGRGRIRPPLTMPDRLKPLPFDFHLGDLPSLAQLGLSSKNTCCNIIRETYLTVLPDCRLGGVDKHKYTRV